MLVAAPAKQRTGDPRAAASAASRQREDRLKLALRALPAGTHSIARIAKAAGLNELGVAPEAAGTGGSRVAIPVAASAW
jgi:hypothetical protein